PTRRPLTVRATRNALHRYYAPSYVASKRVEILARGRAPRARGPRGGWLRIWHADTPRAGDLRARASGGAATLATGIPASRPAPEADRNTPGGEGNLPHPRDAPRLRERAAEPAAGEHRARLGKGSRVKHAHARQHWK